MVAILKLHNNTPKSHFCQCPCISNSPPENTSTVCQKNQFYRRHKKLIISVTIDQNLLVFGTDHPYQQMDCPVTMLSMFFLKTMVISGIFTTYGNCIPVIEK